MKQIHSISREPVIPFVVDRRIPTSLWKDMGPCMFVYRPDKYVGYTLLLLGDQIVALLVKGCDNTSVSELALPEYGSLSDAKIFCEEHWKHSTSKKTDGTEQPTVDAGPD